MNSIKDTLLKHQQDVETLKAEAEKLRQRAEQVAKDARENLGNVGDAGKEVLGTIADFGCELADGLAGMVDSGTFSNIADAIGSIIGGIVENIDL